MGNRLGIGVGGVSIIYVYSECVVMGLMLSRIGSRGNWNCHGEIGSKNESKKKSVG